ncbi:retrotransposon protein, putative, ty1-copia subclass [Tanacetum coccineum]
MFLILGVYSEIRDFNLDLLLLLWKARIPFVGKRGDVGDDLNDHALEFATRILNMVPTKKVDKTPYDYEVSGRAIDLEVIQDKDTSPSEITSEIPTKVNGFKPPQEEVIPIRSYKVAMLDLESDKWLDAMNAEMQSMIDNMVWVLVDLPPNFKTIGKEMFSPVADIRAIRILISIAALYDYEIWQLDVKTAFLNGDVVVVRLLHEVLQLPRQST